MSHKPKFFISQTFAKQTNNNNKNPPMKVGIAGMNFV